MLHVCFSRAIASQCSRLPLKQTWRYLQNLFMLHKVCLMRISSHRVSCTEKPKAENFRITWRFVKEGSLLCFLFTSFDAPANIIMIVFINAVQGIVCITSIVLAYSDLLLSASQFDTCWEQHCGIFRRFGNRYKGLSTDTQSMWWPHPGNTQRLHVICMHVSQHLCPEEGWYWETQRSPQGKERKGTPAVALLFSFTEK